MNDADVLVVGAGLTGLMLASVLAEGGTGCPADRRAHRSGSHAPERSRTPGLNSASRFWAGGRSYQVLAQSGGGTTGRSGSPLMGSRAYRMVSSSLSGSVWTCP